MLTCRLCGKMGHIKIDCHLKTDQNSWVILVPKGQKIPVYLEAIKVRPRKHKRNLNGANFIQNQINFLYWMDFFQNNVGCQNNYLLRVKTKKNSIKKPNIIFSMLERICFEKW